jgi:hypothetical protein
MASQEQLRYQIAMQARQQQMQMMAARQQATAQQHTPQGQRMQPQARVMATQYDDLPITHPSDLGFIDDKPSHVSSFEAACRSGSVSVIDSIIAKETLSPVTLHRGLSLAIRHGQVEAAGYLLEKGAPINREIPENVLSAPQDQQIPLFDLLTRHAWTPNTPGYYGAVLLPRVVTSLPLLRWFLDHGADPNLGVQRDHRDHLGESDTESCDALESASARGSAEAVQMILESGAKISHGTPLNYAAGACPPGTNPHAGPVTPSKEFDVGRIPVMHKLVESGADVNATTESRHMEAQYAIVYAVMAGAVERVRWLLQNGADPHKKGAFGSAKDYASLIGSDEMKRVIEEGIAARRRMD